MADLRAPALAACVALLAAACAHGPEVSKPEGIKTAAEAFWMRSRWRDWSGASEVVVPERRAAFEKARRDRRDEKDLSLTDYELLDVRVKDASHAQVVARVNWVRLPSVSEKSENVTSELVRVDGAWFVAQQDAGPFAPELREPSKKSPATSGPAEMTGAGGPPMGPPEQPTKP